MSDLRDTGAGADSRPDQMVFEDVTEMEHIAGDPEYTAWLPTRLPVRTDTAVSIVMARHPATRINTLPGI